VFHGVTTMKLGETKPRAKTALLPAVVIFHMTPWFDGEQNVNGLPSL
jgi:hypothetical protein